VFTRDLKSKVLISNVSNNSRRGATKAFTQTNETESTLEMQLLEQRAESQAAA